ncbi:glycoside hydrolase family 18 protein [Diplodia corticola]|uniref:chitinase n=1 Tax=Diplodia corticola TaxID=236234 RepID=A0A1J9RWK0_9PEZI|nr:glycoside hydrolase family 18 protein [Diplodia corticola]OJD32751.1 glycoside hydrolase family 18 protein [Diplodia corticola]
MTPASAPSDCSVSAPTKPPFVHGAYYPSWKIYRNQPPSSMDLDIISHVFYAFMRVNEDGTLHHLDEHADLHHPIPGHPLSPNGCLPSLAHLRSTTHPHLALLLSLGGGSGSAPFPRLAASPTARRTLATAIASFLSTHALDGLDLDWEHPSTPAAGRDFLALLRALRAALPRRLLLTCALPAGEWCLRHVPLAEVAEVCDWVNLMCYDFAGGWTPKTGHHARLYASPHRDAGDAYAGRSVHGAVEYVVGRGVGREKVCVGVPVYGRAFVGAGGAGEGFEGVGGGTGEGGCVEYRELPGEGAEGVVVDEEEVGAACVIRGREWVSFDCPRTVAEKARYVRERGLRGLFYWTGVADKEGEGSLLRAGYEGLYGRGSRGTGEGGFTS